MMLDDFSIGLLLEFQNRLFELFVSILVLLIHNARIEGNLDSGIVEMKANVIELQGTPKFMLIIWQASTTLFTFILDRGITREVEPQSSACTGPTVSLATSIQLAEENKK
ncbi:protein strawberry notch-like [Quillaja saponaria]|uniref:Protein strawberry notch-like n=1 Tax=Quillaja saponaria TaxID=32244 RepID=A0AAD7L0L2_QUISA|nr:protein strawberry notch-like [Quillaja saponaria]